MVAKPFATERVPIVGDVASLGGVTVSNVRFYEAERLIHATRTAGNQCLYGPVSSTYAQYCSDSIFKAIILIHRSFNG
nr:MerR family DNA-binding transcriptional regulator [Ralstonia sp. LMG 32965]